MRVISENIANSDSVAQTPGGDPYRRACRPSAPSLIARSTRASSLSVRCATTRAISRSSSSRQSGGGCRRQRQISQRQSADRNDRHAHAQALYEANAHVIGATRRMIARTLDTCAAETESDHGNACNRRQRLRQLRAPPGSAQGLARRWGKRRHAELRGDPQDVSRRERGRAKSDAQTQALAAGGNRNIVDVVTAVADRDAISTLVSVRTSDPGLRKNHAHADLIGALDRTDMTAAKWLLCVRLGPTRHY